LKESCLYAQEMSRQSSSTCWGPSLRQWRAEGSSGWCRHRGT
jgi:hypothetical protein